jgi:hypothetical protein
MWPGFPNVLATQAWLIHHRALRVYAHTAPGR